MTTHREKRELLDKLYAEREELLRTIDERQSALGLEMPPIAPLSPWPEVKLDERGDAVAVISLQGLRRIDAMLQELEQRRESADA